MHLTPHEELFAIAQKLDKAAGAKDSGNIAETLVALKKAAKEVERSFSGSWLGYHSRVYYEGLSPPPPQASFSPEWGLTDASVSEMGSLGKWQKFDPEFVKERIHQMAGEPDLDAAHQVAIEAQKDFGRLKGDIISIFTSEIADQRDVFLEKLKENIEKLQPMSKEDIVQHWIPRGHSMTRDYTALSQGNKVPAHVDVLAELATISHSFEICETAAKISRKAASHVERKSRRKKITDRIGTNVFIGHGSSIAWRDLKDFVQDRLRLPWDEFNRVPIAGVTNIARLSETLDAAAIAFLVMTAEDEMTDGSTRARMNVVHEAGLFQGRLGFTKAIVLLEEGCEEFSNIQGLGQIRFPKDHIAASFEEIRRVLEREGLLSADE